MKAGAIGWIALILVIIGAINWGLVGIGVGDILTYLGDTLATIVYILVGLSGLYTIYLVSK